MADPADDVIADFGRALEAARAASGTERGTPAPAEAVEAATAEPARA